MLVNFSPMTRMVKSTERPMRLVPLLAGKFGAETIRNRAGRAAAGLPPTLSLLDRLENLGFQGVRDLIVASSRHDRSDTHLERIRVVACGAFRDERLNDGLTLDILRTVVEVRRHAWIAATAVAGFELATRVGHDTGSGSGRRRCSSANEYNRFWSCFLPVSYTHLTLPTT